MRRDRLGIAAALTASVLVGGACMSSTPNVPDASSPPIASPDTRSTAAPASAGSSDLITDGGWECLSLPGARVEGGKLILAAGSQGLSLLNDSRLRLQTREDVAISMTVEADAGSGFGGIQFWNSLPPPGDIARWYTTAAKIVLGLAGDRVQVQVYDGTATTPAYQYNARGPSGQSGPLSLRVQREGDTLVLRVADVEVARTKVIGPLTGGPLWFGPAVNKGKTLTIHRLAVTDGAHPRGAEVVRAATPAVAPAATTGTAPSLRTGAAARDRLIGTAMNSRPLRWGQQQRDVAAREFNVLAGADQLDWRVVRPARDQYNFCGVDQLVAFAEANNMRVHLGHLSWHNNPAWLTEGNFSRDELITILREHIQTVVGRYKGRVHAWNVVNEVFEFNNSGRLAKGEPQIWMRVIGPEYIDMAFRWAHEADPQAILLFNGADDEGTGCAARCGNFGAGSRNLKAEAQTEFVKGMLSRGVPIHGVGMQTHWGARQATPTVDPATVAAQMKRLADLGLQVWITEMDVPLLKPVTPEKLAAQAATYRHMLETCLAAANCKAFIVWGFYDGDYADPPWLLRQDANTEGYAAPLLFDESLKPKPAYDALGALLRGR